LTVGVFEAEVGGFCGMGFVFRGGFRGFGSGHGGRWTN
jgi:hypothetical protein